MGQQMKKLELGGAPRGVVNVQWSLKVTEYTVAIWDVQVSKNKFC